MGNSQGEILTYDQYAAIERQGFSQPYVVEIRKAAQHLLFYGSEHTNDLNHPQIQDIEDRWRQFIANAANPIALVEGHFDEVPESETSDRSTAIAEGGEAEFVVHLARRDGVEAASPEPDRVGEANELAKGFGRDAVVFFYFIRQLGWWNGFTDKPDVQVEAAQMLRLMQEAFKWEDVDFSIQRMEAIHQQLFDKPLQWDDDRWIYSVTTPATQHFATNQLARRSGELRDEYIFDQILKYWEEGKSPFLVFGSAHPIRLEPALRKALS